MESVSPTLLRTVQKMRLFDFNCFLILKTLAKLATWHDFMPDFELIPPDKNPIYRLLNRFQNGAMGQLFDRKLCLI